MCKISSTCVCGIKKSPQNPISKGRGWDWKGKGRKGKGEGNGRERKRRGGDMNTREG
jgi:hypothetical protein